jgi:hypothetical protein
MKAVEIARQLNRDASLVSRLCAAYEAVRDLTFNPFKKVKPFSDRICVCSTNGLNYLSDWNGWNNLLTLRGGLTGVLSHE